MGTAVWVLTRVSGASKSNAVLLGISKAAVWEQGSKVGR